MSKTDELQSGAQSLGTDRILTRKRMLGAFSPQAFGHRERINFMFLPPLPLIARGMVLLMVNGAEGYREFVAGLEPKTPRLGKTDVMRMARRSPTNKTGLLGDVAQMLPGSDPLWFANRKHALVDLCTRTVMGCVIRRGRQLLLAASARLSKGDGAVLQVCHQLGRNSGPRQGDSCFRLRLRARTVSIFCSQMANRSSISRASLMAWRSAAANSLGWSKLVSSPPDAERRTHGPIAGACFPPRTLRTPICSRSYSARPKGLPKVASARLVASVSAPLRASSCAWPGVEALASPLPEPSRTMVTSPARTLHPHSRE